MFAEDCEIEALEMLQQADMALIAAQKQAAELPQRATLKAIDAKKKAIREKYAQVSKLSSQIEKQIDRKTEEERLLNEKLAFTQGKIDESAGNFRQIEQLTKDLEGLRTRLVAAEDEHLVLEEKLVEFDKMINQIDVALKALAAQELEAKKAFEAEASKISAFVKGVQDKKKVHAAKINRQLLSEYVAIQKRLGGVALSHLEGTCCSTCRVNLEGRASSLRKQAPITKCPQCGRLMIVSA